MMTDKELCINNRYILTLKSHASNGNSDENRLNYYCAVPKRIKRLACGLLCLLLAINGWMAVGEGEAANAGCGVGRNGIFASDELNRMVDENHAQVVQDGWAELRIPLTLHGITEDMLDPNAVDAARKLMAGGYEVYVVGGAMRDIIMGYACNDFDLATNTSNPEIERLLDEVTFHDVGDMTFAYAHYPDEIVDVATFYNIPRSFHGQPGIPEFDPECVPPIRP